jgi:hypothetical protein
VDASEKNYIEEPSLEVAGSEKNEEETANGVEAPTD